MSDLTPPEGQSVPPQGVPAYPGQYPPPVPPYPGPGYPGPGYPGSGYPGPGYSGPSQPPAAFGQTPYSPPQYWQSPYAPPAGDGRDPSKRPGTVTAAAVTTWVATTLVLLAGLVVLALALADDDDFFTSLTEDADVSRADVRLITIIVSVVILVWSLSASVLAGFAFRRHNWARILLVVSAVVSVPFLLISIFAVVPGFLAIAAVVTVVLLFTGGANEWYRTKDLPGTTHPGPTYS